MIVNGGNFLMLALVYFSWIWTWLNMIAVYIIPGKWYRCLYAICSSRHWNDWVLPDNFVRWLSISDRNIKEHVFHRMLELKELQGSSTYNPPCLIAQDLKSPMMLQKCITAYLSLVIRGQILCSVSCVQQFFNLHRLLTSCYYYPHSTESKPSVKIALNY